MVLIYSRLVLYLLGEFHGWLYAVPGKIIDLQKIINFPYILSRRFSIAKAKEDRNQWIECQVHNIRQTISQTCFQNPPVFRLTSLQVIL